jgi:PAS domain S-box-containing protein
LSVKVPIKDHQGTVYGMCGISTDITERKRSEERLRASEERLRMALAASHVGIWDWDVSTGALYWSAGVEHLFGLASGSFSGEYAAYLDLIYWEDRGAVLSSIARSLREHTSVGVSHRVIWPDGSLHWLVWTGRIYRDAGGSAIRVLGTVHDASGPSGTDSDMKP